MITPMTNLSRPERIIQGLTSQNEQAEFEGRKGFWVQGDAVFIEASNPVWAINNYRDELSKGKIGCSHNYGCSSICGIIFTSKLTSEQFKAARKEIKL